MSEKAPKQKLVSKKAKRTAKHYVAVVLFGAIIIVFALWGISPARMGGGDAGGGVAASVNDSTISMAEFRTSVENMEARQKQQLAQLPESLRRQLEAQAQAQMKMMRQQALDGLIVEEVFFQAATNHGVLAPDSEIRDSILEIPSFQENGRFRKERYQGYLQYVNLSSADFERQIRKSIVRRKFQELFVGATEASREEVKRNRELAANKVNLRFVELKKSDFEKPGFISDDDVNKYMSTNAADIEGYYKDNQVEFIKPQMVQARHILIRIDDKRNEAQALKIATDLRKQANTKNFAALAAKNSDDPGSKVKGGDLGTFERGRMVPEFENVAFSLPEGQISPPVKTDFGYHLIYVEKKTAGGTEPLAAAKSQIARKLLLRNKEAEVVAHTKSLLEKGSKKDVDSFVQKAGLKWADTGEFNLAAHEVPKIGASSSVVRAVMKHGKTPGLVNDLITENGKYYIVDIASWKNTPDTSGDAADQAAAPDYRKSTEVIEAWAKEATAKASIQRNQRIVQ